MKKMILAMILAAFSATPAAAVGNGEFSLSIRGASEDSQGYVRMRQGQTYAVCFQNHTGNRADVELNIDGLSQGTWRLNAYQRACTERPANDYGRFTFYRSESQEGYQVGSQYVPTGDRGRISATFYPEATPIYYHDGANDWAYGAESSGGYSNGIQPRSHSYSQAPSAGYDAAPRARSYTSPTSEGASSGVTGLSGHSNQNFGTAHELERDYNRQVTLELRLIHSPRVEPHHGPRPLPGRVFNPWHHVPRPYYRPAPAPLPY